MAISLRGLDPAVRERAELALRIAVHFGIPTSVTSTFRSWAEQQALRDRFLEGRSRFPANAPGDSAHNFGLAWDSTTEPEFQADWDYIRWWVGFDIFPNDIVHAEVPGWRQFI